jgi:hypothetical protein
MAAPQVQGRSSDRERAIVAAGEAILAELRRQPQVEVEPAIIVQSIARLHDSYSTRAALLYLIERKKVRVTKEWRVLLVT